MAESDDKPKPSTPAPRYLYHKEKPQPRPRSSAAPTPEPVLGAEFEADNRTSPAMAAMVASVRKFAIAVVAMVILLLIAIAALRVYWGAKDRALRSRPSLPPAERSTAAATGSAEIASGIATQSARAVDLNTEAIRRAVFLAKHAESLEEAGKTAEAIERYREALDVWPYLTAVWGQLGRLYLTTRDFSRAQIALEKAVESNPGSAELLNDLGAAYLFQNKVDKAENLFDAAMEIDPQYAPSIFNLALCHLARGARGPARDALARYLRLQPTDARALREIAFLDALDQRYPDALDALEKALVESPDWPLLYFDAAAVTALMGRPDQAIRYLERAEPLTDPSTVYRLYQEPAFREIRLTELGKMFEADIAGRARERMTGDVQLPDVHKPSEPIRSTDYDG